MTESAGADLEAARTGRRGQAVLFNVDHDTLTNIDLIGEVSRLPEATARQYGFAGESLDFLVDVGLPSAVEYELSFGLPQEFDAGFVWDCSAAATEGWTVPDGVTT